MRRLEAVCPAGDPALGLLEGVSGIRAVPCPPTEIPGSSGSVVVSETGAGHGLAVLDAVRGRDGTRPVIVIADAYVPATASEAIRRGASDYLALDALDDPVAALAERLERVQVDADPELGASAFRALAESVGDAILTVDTDNRVVFANDGVEDLTGYSHDELVGSSLLEIAPERMRTAHRQGFERYLETGEQALDWNYIELPISHRAGHEITVALSFGEFERDGRRYFTGVIRDVTDRKRRATELCETRERLEDILSRIGDAFFAVDTEWRFTYVNEKAEELLDRPASELVGENVWEEFPAAMAERFYDEYHRAMETGEAVTFEEYFAPLSTWFEVRAYPSADGLSVYFQDVTTRKERERLLNDLLDTNRALIDALSRDGVAERVAEAAAETLGFEINAVHLYDEEIDRLFPTAVTERTRQLIGEPPTYAVGEGVVGEAFAAGVTRIHDDVRAADGFEYGPIRSSMTLPLGEHGTLSVGSLDPGRFDATDRQVAELLTASAQSALERLVRERELRRYGSVLETVQEMVYVLDTEGRCTMATQPLADRLGYEREAMIGRSADEILNEAAIEQGQRAIARLLANPDSVSETYETTARTTDGDCFPVEVELSLLEDEGFVGTVGVIRDISELERAKKELGDERDRFTYLFETLPDPVDEVMFEDGEPIVRGVNAAFERTFGYDGSELVGSPLPEAFSMPMTAKEAVEHTMATTVGTRQFLFRRVPYRSDGDRYAFGIYTDITPLKERERQLKVLHRALRHDLRNGLNVVTAAANQLAAAECRTDRRDLAGVLEERAHSLVALSEDAAAIERTIANPDGAGRIDAVPIVESTVERYRDELAIETDLPQTLPVIADHRLGSAMSSLLENVREHCPPEGGEEGRPHARVTLERAGGVGELRVEDDGPGIPAFERELVDGTREITQLEHGSGLGLWLVKWTVESYGGRVAFEEGPGTTVLIHLPLANVTNDLPDD